MTNKKILIITHTGDNECIKHVSNHIQTFGGEVIRFNVDNYPTKTSLTTLFTNNKWNIILDNGEKHYLDNLSAVWYRRSHHIGSGIEKIIDQQYFAATMGEVKRTLHGMIEGLPCFQMERFSTYRRLDSKEEQLKIASKCGLQIPPTCISNSAEQVTAFIQRTGKAVVAKMQSSFSIQQHGNEQVVFTNEINQQQLDEFDNLQFCPMVFQQKLEKKLELRVTIVGDKIFAFAIDSQKEPNAQIDWRKEGLTLMNSWHPFNLPSYLTEQLLAFMDIYKLNYGAIDLILTPDDQFYFLEINPAGEYFWLDKLCNNAISKQIAAVLLDLAYRRT